jgi:hypothetical protein
MKSGLIKLCLSGAEMISSITDQHYRERCIDLRRIVHCAVEWASAMTGCDNLRRAVVRKLLQLPRSDVLRLLYSTANKIWFVAVANTIRESLLQALQMYCDSVRHMCTSGVFVCDVSQQRSLSVQGTRRSRRCNKTTRLRRLPICFLLFYALSTQRLA